MLQGRWIDNFILSLLVQEQENQELNGNIGNSKLIRERTF